MRLIAQTKPFTLEIKDDMFLSDGDIAVLDSEDKSFKYEELKLDLPGEKIFEWLKNRGVPNTDN